MKYLKTIIFEFILLICLTLLLTILYYFNIISSNINNIFKIVSFIVTFFLTGVYISKRSNRKYYLEGLKISGINIAIFLLISLIFKFKFSLQIILYYLIITITITIGSIIGSLFKKNKK